MPDEPRGSRALPYAGVLLLTLAVAVWGVVLVPLRLPGGTVAPVSVLLGLLVVPLCREGGRLGGSRWGAAVPGFVWFSVVAVLSSGRREGDALVPGNNPVGLVFLVVGTLAAAVAVGAWRPASPEAAGSRSTRHGAER